jgi:cytochrome c peroxidase
VRTPTQIRFSAQALAVGSALLCMTMAAFSAGAPLEEPIKPIPQRVQVDTAKAAIGRQLFRDPRMSGNGRIACSNCHQLTKGGADGQSHSVGFDGKLTSVNAPTVFNAALNFKQFWNGRADSLESQIDLVVQNPVEMGSSWSEVTSRIAQDPGYQRAFAAAYKDGISKDNIENAIATYERTLITPNSRFDRYLRGEANALSAQEKAGYSKFKQYGCIACHQGVNVGGNMFQKFGIMGDYFHDRGKPVEADLGRFRVTNDPSDAHVFKVPSLRNVAMTAPYFHDGTAATLDEAVGVMFKYQLGRVASRDDKAAIVSFLNTLTGDVSDHPL